MATYYGILMHYVCMHSQYVHTYIHVHTFKSSETTVAVSQVEQVSEMVVDRALDAVSNSDNCCCSKESR